MAENTTAPTQASTNSGQNVSEAAKAPPLTLLASSPHIASPVTARPLMLNVIIALMPATVFGILQYGFHSLFNILVSIIAAMAGETLFRKIIKRESRIGDCSAIITGLLLALILPPDTPLWINALGAVFAIVVAKEFFGGLGANVFNPALIGRAFLLMSFPATITTFRDPRGLNAILNTPMPDAISSVTPLDIIKLGGTIGDVGQQFVATGLSESADYWSIIRTLFIGNRGGSMGEASIALILVGAAYLLITKTIDWRTPVAMVCTALVAAFAFGLDPLFAIFSGGLLFGAVFMATDYVSTPVTSTGKILFGIGAGFISILVRKFGNYPEGVTYGILFMNVLTPFYNRLLQKKYGFVPKTKGRA